MTPRRLPLRLLHTLPSDRPLAHRVPVELAPVGWTRKTLAVATHFTCLAFFGLLVVWPVASPIASGELAREFKPVLQALATWVSAVPLPAH